MHTRPFFYVIAPSRGYISDAFAYSQILAPCPYNFQENYPVNMLEEKKNVNLKYRQGLKLISNFLYFYH